MYSSETQLKQQTLLLNDLYIDTVGHQVKLGQTEIDLTVKEFDLLCLFVRKKGMVVRHSELLRTLSVSDQIGGDGIIRVHICRLRKKIEAEPHRPKRLVSVRSIGYRLKG